MTSCDTNYTEVGNACVMTNQTQPCFIANGSGEQASTDGGQTRGTCMVTSCGSGYTEVGNVCVLIDQMQDCSITNGSGQQHSTDGGLTR